MATDNPRAEVDTNEGGRTLRELEDFARENGLFYANVPPIIDPARRQHLAELVNNWDSYRGEPPSEAALQVLDSMSLVPTVGGGWEIEVHVGKEEASIEVNADGQIDSVWWSR